MDKNLNQLIVKAQKEIESHISPATSREDYQNRYFVEMQAAAQTTRELTQQLTAMIDNGKTFEQMSAYADYFVACWKEA